MNKIKQIISRDNLIYALCDSQLIAVNPYNFSIFNKYELNYKRDDLSSKEKFRMMVIFSHGNGI